MWKQQLEYVLVLAAFLAVAANIWAMCATCVNGRGEGEMDSGQVIYKCPLQVKLVEGFYECQFNHERRCDKMNPACHCAVVRGLQTGFRYACACTTSTMDG
jgi:hypothetical protein